MGKKQPNTPRSRIRSAIRQTWLRSRERAKVLKDAGYCCSKCGVKQSKAKGREVSIQVHHISGINIWNKVIDMIAQDILESEQECLCKDCHNDTHKEDLT